MYRLIVHESGDGLRSIRDLHVAVDAHVGDACVSQESLAEVQSCFEQREHNRFFNGFAFWGFLFGGFFFDFLVGSPCTILRELFQFLYQHS